MNPDSILPSVLEGWMRVIKEAEYCPVRLPWFWLGGREKVKHLHELALKVSRDSSLLSKIKWSIAWPLISIVRVIEALSRYGNEFKIRYKISRLRQFCEVLKASSIYNISPESYYKYNLFKKDENTLRGYIFHHEIKGLLRYIHQQEDVDRIDGKVRFFEECKSFDLPTASILVVFYPAGKERWFSQNRTLPPRDLFLKPANEWGGRGARCFRYDPHFGKWSHQDLKVGQDGLLNCCRELVDDEPIILQERLKNNDKVDRFSNGGLCTLRVVTGKRPQNEPELLLSSWRMPTGQSPVDNFAAGGIASPVTENGKLGAAVDRNATGEMQRHPDTGAQIEGEYLPSYSKMTELALRAHELFGEPYFVGWDIALTKKGAIILEGNTVWCEKLAQMPHNRPLSETKFADIFFEVKESQAYISNDYKKSETKEF